MKKTCSRGHVFEKSSLVPSCPVCWPGRYKKTAKNSCSFQAKVWLYPGDQAAWHFITIPEELSASIKETYRANAKGWGSIPVEIVIGKTSWKTSIFPDRKRNAYLLPLKASVRKKEGIEKGDQMKVAMKICS